MIEYGDLADENDGSAPLPCGPMPTHGSGVQHLEVWSTSASTEVDWARWSSGLLGRRVPAPRGAAIARV